ncbi:PEP-CTERM sorting domain-containing protein [Paludisphaera soli]|uniref:PEP-CTERM sorting domain-containing protein n=1 Tax=Paludisphaera soli TaxID=2712865 RepID=UPI0013EA7C9F|nr:PEP-CTERM sorting domain-containing protein [Paludisphaera soli]
MDLRRLTTAATLAVCLAGPSSTRSLADYVSRLETLTPLREESARSDAYGERLEHAQSTHHVTDHGGDSNVGFSDSYVTAAAGGRDCDRLLAGSARVEADSSQVIYKYHPDVWAATGVARFTAEARDALRLEGAGVEAVEFVRLYMTVEGSMGSAGAASEVFPASFPAFYQGGVEVGFRNSTDPSGDGVVGAYGVQEAFTSWGPPQISEIAEGQRLGDGVGRIYVDILLGDLRRSADGTSYRVAEYGLSLAGYVNVFLSDVDQRASGWMDYSLGVDRVVLADGSTPESRGLTLAFASGMRSPNPAPAAVPEPGSLALLVVGASVLGAASRRRAA